MIISHQHRYLFVENPLTASWAIRYELCEYYGGAPILHKHATYPEFLESATEEERSYFAFVAIRNPLDKLVSRYFKLKTDHKGIFSDPESSIETHRIDYSDRKKYEFIRSSNATFENFFLKYCKRPYSDLVDLSSGSFDFVIRYERLQDDFAEVLRLLGIRQVRPVPVMNKTQGRKAEWEPYYSPGIIKQAKKVCGPFMKKWGYEFPPGWGDYQVSWPGQLEFYLVSRLRNVYLHHFRYSNRAYARFVRLLRAHMIE